MEKDISLIIKNVLPLLLIAMSLTLILCAEYITKKEDRIQRIDNFAQALLFGSGVMIKGERDN